MGELNRPSDKLNCPKEVDQQLRERFWFKLVCSKGIENEVLAAEVRRKTRFPMEARPGRSPEGSPEGSPERAPERTPPPGRERERGSCAEPEGLRTQDPLAIIPQREEHSEVVRRTRGYEDPRPPCNHSPR